MLKYYPLPDYGVNEYLEKLPGNRDDYQWMLKGDYYLGTKDVLTARYFWDSDTLDHAEATVPGFLAHNAFHNRTFLVTIPNVFDTWVFHSAFNYLQTYRKETPVSAITPQSIGVQAQPAQSGIPNKIYFTISGYTKLFSGTRPGIRSSSLRISGRRQPHSSANTSELRPPAFVTTRSIRSAWPMN